MPRAWKTIHSSAHAHREVTLGQGTTATGDSRTSESYSQVMAKAANLSSEFLARNPQPRRVYIHKGSIWHFSKIEIEHLFQATLAFSLALAFMSVGGMFRSTLNSPIRIFRWMALFWMIPIAPAFIVHELAHKFLRDITVVGPNLEHLPEVLDLELFLPQLLGIVFMAPGAVMVMGNTTKSQFGKIALAGPSATSFLGYRHWIDISRS